MNIKFENIELQFATKTDCLPTKIVLDGRTALKSGLPLFSAILDDGRTIRPFNPSEREPLRSSTDEVLRLTFQNLKWRDENDVVVDDFHMSITYEIWNDGAIFADTFFMVENTNGPKLLDFKLEIPLDIGNSDLLRWGFIDRPTASDFAMIQSSSPERFLKAGTNRVFENKIVPLFTFDGKNSTGFHYEVFVEGHSTLSKNPEHASTEITWEGETAKVAWNFQTEEASCGERPWQWRNRWGLLLAGAPTQRNLPPLRMYHYFDNYERYPSEALIARIADSGADVLILHENWRLDTQNGGIPYDHDAFKQVVDSAHDKGVRIALYIRGNEDSAYSGSCAWFDELLEKNSDGLYMDYGGPIHVIETPTENFQGGRMKLREHHQNIRNVRKRVGRDGIFFSHTGPCFSALGMTNGGVDGYVSGEGERGLMLENREFHEYFSGAYATTGSMWTAAFPEYGSARMIPFMAATGQFPHAPLGVQFENSSLAHPQSPGLNDVYLRPLWKLWGLFKKESRITIFNDYNSENVFLEKSSETGAYLMVSEDARKALLIVSNFNESASSSHLKIDWSQTGFEIEKCSKCLLFSPTLESQEAPIEYDQTKDSFESQLDGLGVAGWLFSIDEYALNDALVEYKKPYIKKDDYCDNYQKKIESQQKARISPPIPNATFLKIEVANLATPYEESMWWDLFDNSFQLGIFDSNDEFNPLGWISTKGFTAEKPKKSEYILPGHRSPWIDLSEILPSEGSKIGIRSIHMGEPFYSFIKATLSTNPEDGGNSYEIEFYNEIEGDRSFLKFNIK